MVAFDRRLAQLKLARRCLVVSALALTMPAVAQLTDSATSSSDTVRVSGGQITGTTLASGVKAYLGIPYAKAPVGDLRWRATQPVVPWAGSLKADHMGAVCPQRGDLGPQSEDCLFLNVWAPKGAKPGGRAPVVVWLHGGAFTRAAANLPRYGGESLAQRGAVFVSFNYRLGFLGRLAHPELTAESGTHSSGNYSRLDQIAALRWVKANIRQFGGDPNNVTLMGQSSGGMDVGVLYVSPLAKGLFNRVIELSGSGMDGPGGPDKTLPQAEQDGLGIQALLKTNSIAEMRQVSAATIVNMADAPTTEGGPLADGYVLPKPAKEILREGGQNDVPAILGYMREDIIAGSPKPATSVAEYRAELVRSFGIEADQLFAYYPATTDAEAKPANIRLQAALDLGRIMTMWANAVVATGKSPIYMYQFVEGKYVPHGKDTSYWLGNLDIPGTSGALTAATDSEPVTDADQKLSELMQKTIFAFARSNNPSTPGLIWPRYDLKQPSRLLLSSKPQQEALPESLLFLVAHPELRNGRTARLPGTPGGPAVADLK